MISLENLINDNNDIPQFESISTESFDDKIKEIQKLYKDIYFENIESSEGIGKFVIKGITFVLKIITKIIMFITKCIVLISEFIINKITSFIAFLTKSKKPNKKKSESFIQRLRNIDLSKESKEDDKNSIIEFVKYIRNFIKKPDEIKNMSKEELIFYKTFLINGNPQNIKLVCDTFNRETSKLKENGIILDKIGHNLLFNSKFNSSESLEYSMEDDTRKYSRIGDELSNNVKVNNSSDMKKDYLSIINNMYATIYSDSSDSVWLNRIKNIFTNGSKELEIIMKDLKKKQAYLEKIRESKNINESFKDNLNKYTKEIQSFQPSIYSYINCANYFNKYQSIRINVINKFCILVNKGAA